MLVWKEFVFDKLDDPSKVMLYIYYTFYRILCALRLNVKHVKHLKNDRYYANK